MIAIPAQPNEIKPFLVGGGAPSSKTAWLDPMLALCRDAEMGSMHLAAAHIHAWLAVAGDLIPPRRSADVEAASGGRPPFGRRRSLRVAETWRLSWAPTTPAYCVIM